MRKHTPAISIGFNVPENMTIKQVKSSVSNYFFVHMTNCLLFIYGWYYQYCTYDKAY
jgi:hypothetical protein